MQSFIMDELSAEETRADRMAEAKAHRRQAQVPKKRPAIRFYCALGRLGGLLKKLRLNSQNRNDPLAIEEQDNALAS